MIRWSKGRDITAGVFGVMSGFGGLVGAGVKKLFIDKNDSFGKKFMVGLATTVLTLGTGLLPYLIASPGRDAQADMMQARQGVAQNRYGAAW